MSRRRSHAAGGRKTESRKPQAGDRTRFPFPPGSVHELPIDALAQGGGGLGRVDGWPVFVPRTAPGDVARVEITEAQARHGRAKLLGLVTASADRRSDVCVHADSCGGCDWPHVPFPIQERTKVELFRQTLGRVGGLRELAADLPLPIESFPGGYRLRSQLHVARGDRGVVVGFRGARSHVPFDLRSCEIAGPATVELADRLRSALREIEALPETIEVVESRTGAERALLVHGGDPAELEAALAPLARGVIFRSPSGERRVGEPSVTIDVAGTPHRVSADAFFQVNRHALDRFVGAVTDLLPERIDVAWDLYAGGGFFSFPLARRSRLVHAVDVDGPSVEDARATAERIGATNLRFEALPVERFLRRPPGPPPEVVLVDPPRAGLSAEVRERLIALRPPRIVSVSCDAATFARDAAALVAAGWSLGGVRLLDLFPGTYRVESVALFAR